MDQNSNLIKHGTLHLNMRYTTFRSIHSKRECISPTESRTV